MTSGPLLRQRSVCPCCESRDVRVICSQSYGSPELRNYLDTWYQGRADAGVLANFYYELVRCRVCRVVYQRTIPGDRLLSTIYDEWIPPSEKDRLRRERSLDDFCYIAEQIQFLIRHLDSKPCDIRVLDFGMGWGEWAAMARAFGCEVAGCELSLVRVQHARAIGIEIVDWEAIPKGRFQFINSEQVFEHLAEPLVVLKHLARALDKECGVIRISVPDSRSALRRLSRNASFGRLPARHVMPLAPLEHINCFEWRSLVAFAAMAGLRPVRPRLRHLYNSSSGWLNLRNGLKLALRPIYRHVFPKSTIMYFSL